MTRLRPPVAPGLALLPLRLFLGVTFAYAGVEKLADPGYLHDGAPSYIGSQLDGFSDGTPGGVVLRALALPHPALAGIGVAVLEVAVGVLVFAGLLTRVAALTGLGLNLLLFLTATWRTRPYFMGSDIVFVFAWLPLVLAGSAGQPGLERVLGRRRPLPLARGRTFTRREALGAAGLVTIALAGGASLFRGPYRTRVESPPAATTASDAPTPIAEEADLARGQAVTFANPATGESGILIREKNGDVVAFSASCTHAGCEVAFRNGQLRCPCHGGVFDARTGAVVAGPPPAPLPRIAVVERDGAFYAKDA